MLGDLIGKDGAKFDVNVQISSKTLIELFAALLIISLITVVAVKAIQKIW